MAKCKDCGTKTGFLEARCSSCLLAFNQANIAAEAQRAQHDREFGEQSRFESAKANLYYYEDKFTGQSQYSSEEFSLKHPRGYGFAGNLKMIWTAMNDGTYWLTATQRMNNWEWLHDNSTILLLPGGERFVQENIDLRAHDTQTAGYDVVCIETHIINVTSIIDKLDDFYETNKHKTGVGIDGRIGQTEFLLDIDKLRLAAALHEKMKEVLS